MTFIERIDGSQYENFLFSPIWNDDFTKIGAVQLEFEKNWEASPPVNIYEYTYLNKEDVERLITYLQKQLEEM